MEQPIGKPYILIKEGEASSLFYMIFGSQPCCTFLSETSSPTLNLNTSFVQPVLDIKISVSIWTKLKSCFYNLHTFEGFRCYCIFHLVTVKIFSLSQVVSFFSEIQILLNFPPCENGDIVPWIYFHFKGFSGK